MRLIFILLFVVNTSSAFAQGAAPFWEPLPGPPGPSLQIGFVLGDSTISTMNGGSIYFYDSTSMSWVLTGGPEGKLVLSQRKFNFLPLPVRYWPGLHYASYEDTLFFTPDSGGNWSVVGTFGTHPTKFNAAARPIVYLAETGGRVELIDDSNRLYSTADTFKTIDTGYLPEIARSLSRIGDTVYLWSAYGNLYRSVNFGKNWKELFGLHDTATNWYSDITRKGDVWILYDLQQSPVSPWGDTNVHLAYSLDRGNDWTMMTSPVNNKFPEIDGIDNEGRIYIHFELAFDSIFRSDDWGRTWHKLSLSTTTIYVVPSGTLYAGSNLRSTDYGETWDTIPSPVTASVPFDILAFQDSTVLSAQQGIYATSDNGQTWPALTTGYSDARLSIRPDSGWIMVNTTQRFFPGHGALCSKFQIYGLGRITSELHVWLTSSWGSWLNEWDTAGMGSWHGTWLTKYYLSESLDTGCSYVSFSYDTLSPSPILQVVEWAHDTILAISTSGVYRGFDVLFPFDTVTPELGTHTTPTGAMLKDSTGAIYVAMSDGKLFVTRDGANTWSEFASPEPDGSAPIISMTASPTGLLFAADSNLATGYTRTWEYNPAKKAWVDVTVGLRRAGFPDTAEVTNIWYVNGYAYAGTWNMGLFRSVKPVGPVSSVASAAHATPFKLYPNPAANSVTVTYPAYIHASGYLIADMAGRECMRGTIEPNSTKVTIDIRALTDGIYDLKMVGGDWLPTKFVVEH